MSSMISRRGAVFGASAAFLAPPLAASAASAAIVPFRHAATEDAHGGHFAPLEGPALYAQELRNCFRSQRTT